VSAREIRSLYTTGYAHRLVLTEPSSGSYGAACAHWRHSGVRRRARTGRPPLGARRKVDVSPRSQVAGETMPHPCNVGGESGQQTKSKTHNPRTTPATSPRHRGGVGLTRMPRLCLVRRKLGREWAGAPGDRSGGERHGSWVVGDTEVRAINKGMGCGRAGGGHVQKSRRPDRSTWKSCRPEQKRRQIAHKQRLTDQGRGRKTNTRNPAGWCRAMLNRHKPREGQW